MQTLGRDVFNPLLVSSQTQSLEVSIEQQDYIKQILDYACSDSRFAKKAYDAIWLVLTRGAMEPATVTSLNPSSVAIGAEPFDIHVMGTGFNQSSVILFNGLEEPTTHVSDTELTTGINMPLWTAPAVVPVSVVTNGVASESQNFEFTAPAGRQGQGSREGYITDEEVKRAFKGPEIKK